MKSDFLPTGIMSELRQSNNEFHSTKSYGWWRLFSFDVTTACCINIKWISFGRRSHESNLLPTGIMSVLRQSNNDWHSSKFYGLWRIISFDATPAGCLKIKWNNFVRRSHEKWFITDGHHVRNSDNQTTTDIRLCITDYEGLFHFLSVVSKSNEVTLIGDQMKSDLFPTGIMSELRQSNNDWHSTESYGI